MTERIGVTYLPALPINGPPYHMALFYDKGDGSKPSVIEFAPQNKFLGSSEKAQEAWRDLRGSSGSTSRFGPLVGIEREWNTRGLDSEANDSLRPQEIIAEGNDLSAPWAIIQGTKDEANVSRYTYLPWSQNSNTSAMASVARAGLRRPSGVATDVNGDVHVYWPPGAGNRLTSPQSSDIKAQPMSYEFTTSPDEPAPLVKALSSPSPWGIADNGMPLGIPAAIPPAPFAPGGPFDSLRATPPDYRGVPPASGGPLGWPQSYPGGDRGAFPASAPQTKTLSDELPTLWNGVPIPPALREVAAWASRTAPQPNPADIPGTTLTGTRAQMTPQQVSAPGQQSPESLLPPELRPLVRLFGLDGS